MKERGHAVGSHHYETMEGGLRSTRRLELVSATPLRRGAVALHYRRAR